MTRKILTAAVFALSTALALPAMAGGSFNVQINPTNADERNMIRTGLAIYAIANAIHSDADIYQNGQGNGAAIAQRGNNSFGTIYQDGNGHSGTLAQNGNSQAFGLFQFGRGTNANVVQTGHGDTGLLFQFGW